MKSWNSEMRYTVHGRKKTNKLQRVYRVCIFLYLFDPILVLSNILMFALVEDDVSDYPSLLLDPCVLSMIQMLVLDILFECSFRVWTLSLRKAGWRWNELKSSNMMEKYAHTLEEDILQIVNCDQGLWHFEWWTAELTTDKLARGLELLRVLLENVF